MNFFKRALKNVTRKWSKSVLLLITFFMIGNFVIVGLGISSASETAKTLTRQKMRAVVTYEVDYDAIQQHVDSLTDEDEISEFYSKGYPQIKLKDVEDILKNEHILAANAYNVDQFYELDGGVEFVKLNNEAEQNTGIGMSCYQDEEGNEVCNEYRQPNFAVKSNYFPNMIELVDEEYQIVDGRFYTLDEIDSNANVVLVSKALADLNGIGVGDRVKFSLISPTDRYYVEQGVTIEDATLELEVIGIYNHNKPITPDNENFNWTAPYENPDNMLLMPASTISNSRVNISQKVFDKFAELNPEDEYYSDPNNRPTLENSTYINSVTFLLDDPLMVDKFVEEYQGNIAEFMKIDAHNEEFDRLSKPLDTLSLYANFIVWLVVINAVVIITLVTALTLKTREYEIGVLLSIGASKFKVVAQFFVELALVAIIGFTLSIVSGSLIANKVGQSVLDYQISASEVSDDNQDDFISYPSIWNEDYTTDISLEDLIAEYNVSISPIIIAEIYVVGLGIVLVSIIIPSMMIMRFNPKKILMNQN